MFAFNSPVRPLPAAGDDHLRVQAAGGDARRRHGLGERLARAGRACPFPPREYNAALQAITDRFAGRGARPGHPNGSAINAVRTNEIDFGDNGLWELREFALSATTGHAGAGDRQADARPQASTAAHTLASFVNANEAAIIAETHDVPEQFEGAPFLGGAVFNDRFTLWNAPGINNNEARHHFSLNTCNGCHSARDRASPSCRSPRASRAARPACRAS